MRYASVTDRLADLGSAKWELHLRARALRAAGREIIELTIGEPDVPTPPELIRAATEAMEAGRTGYSNGRGEPGLVAALAASVLSGVIATRVFDLPWQPNWTLTAAGALLGMLAALIAGMFATRRVLDAPPSVVLREL